MRPFTKGHEAVVALVTLHSQAWVARRAGVTQQAVSGWITAGAQPRLPALLKLVALGVPLLEWGRPLGPRSPMRQLRRRARRRARGAEAEQGGAASRAVATSQAER